ncbi:MAG: hypothetical protein EB015_04510 [Methylocystaceae bacterium]|jgi:hypothetical protein|nr:hypothetical protein [Methylocystaceae bacterium]
MRIKITPPAGQTPEQVQEHLRQWRERTHAAIDALPGDKGDKLRARRDAVQKIVSKLNTKIVIGCGARS